MKSLKTVLSLVVALFITSSVASAATYTFVDWDLKGLYSYKFLGAGQSYAGQWDISDSPGFSSSLVFTDATADFWFADDSSSDSSEYVKIQIGNPLSTWIASEEVDGTISYTVNLLTYDLVSGSLSASLLLQIADDGKLSYKVTATSGDSYLKETRLTVHARSRQVPENGSTLALIGLGLVGLAIIKRRK